jgi:hypothetical protein
MAKCAICGCETHEDNIKHIEIKGNVKNICQGCITAIKGFR